MPFKSQVFLTSGTFTVPPNVSLIFANILAGGGGGGCDPDIADSAGKAAGGASEFVHMLPISVTPGSSVPIVIGAGGAGGKSATSTNATQGGTSSVSGFTALGGKPSLIGTSSTIPGNGGGALGGIGPFPEFDPALKGVSGFAETTTAFGGPSGGQGEGANLDGGGAGGQMIGQYSSPGTPNGGDRHPGGSGGCTAYGVGGASSSNGAGQSAAANSGSGGGGSSGRAGAIDHGNSAYNGGDGGSGLAIVFWIAP